MYRLAGNIAERVKAMPDLPRGEQFAAIAQLIDSLIHSNYEIYDNNRIAYDQLNPDKKTGGYTSEAEAAIFEIHRRAYR